VLEAIGGINFQKSVQVLKPFGTIVTLPSGHTKADELQAQKKQLHAPVISCQSIQVVAICRK